MANESHLKVVLCWHMHQPDYRDHSSGEYQLPWTYLHAIKDYVDMAAHLEHYPQVRAVVNFAPVLLVQIEDYSKQIQQYFDNNRVLSDPLLQSLVAPIITADSKQCLALVNACTKANTQHMIQRFKPFRDLVEHALWIQQNPGQVTYLSAQFFADLLVWYHIAWLGETVRRRDRRIKDMIAKASGYTRRDRLLLLAIIGHLLSTLTDRYRRLMERGQIELSLSPYAHPMVPLLVDARVAAQAMPGITLPTVATYPDGTQRARWHLQSAITVFKRHFGTVPRGCWLSEGGISEASVTLLDELKFTWTASGENVLRNSLQGEAEGSQRDKADVLYRPYRLNSSKLRCFFRDDELSDLIGFSYASWHGDDAAADLINRLVAVADSAAVNGNTVVSIILDGENAWESYPNNGYFFLDALYRGLTNHPRLQLTTFADCVEGRGGNPCEPGQLSQIVAGSWVYGSFSTWIGEAQKNRAWDMLADAKRCFDQVMEENILNEGQRERALLQLAICESSDWFWWFGDVNPVATVVEFDRLFRMHLANLYLFLRRQPPAYLADEHFTSSGDGHPPLGGSMKPGSPP